MCIPQRQPPAGRTAVRRHAVRRRGSPAGLGDAAGQDAAAASAGDAEGRRRPRVRSRRHLALLVRGGLPQGLDDAGRAARARPEGRGRRAHAAAPGRRLPDRRPRDEGRRRPRLHVPQAREAPGARAAEGVAGERAQGDRDRPDGRGPPGGDGHHRLARAVGGHPLLLVAARRDAGRPGARRVPQVVRRRRGHVRRVPRARDPGHHRGGVHVRPLEEVARGRPEEPRGRPRLPQGAAVRPRGGQLGPPPGPVALGARPGVAALGAGARGRRPGLHALRGQGDGRGARAWCRASCATRASTRSASRG